MVQPSEFKKISFFFDALGSTYLFRRWSAVVVRQRRGIGRFSWIEHFIGGMRLFSWMLSVREISRRLGSHLFLLVLLATFVNGQTFSEVIAFRFDLEYFTLQPFDYFVLPTDDVGLLMNHIFETVQLEFELLVDFLSVVLQLFAQLLDEIREFLLDELRFVAGCRMIGIDHDNARVAADCGLTIGGLRLRCGSDSGRDVGDQRTERCLLAVRCLRRKVMASRSLVDVHVRRTDEAVLAIVHGEIVDRGTGEVTRRAQWGFDETRDGSIVAVIVVAETSTVARYCQTIGVAERRI